MLRLHQKWSQECFCFIKQFMLADTLRTFTTIVLNKDMYCVTKDRFFLATTRVKANGKPLFCRTCSSGPYICKWFIGKMMTSSNANIFFVTGPWWGKSIGHRWIPLTKASDTEVWCFLWSAPEQTVKQTIETPVIRNAIALIMTSL